MAKDYRICESMETIETMGASAVTTEDLLAIILGNREKAHKLLHQDETLFTGVKDGLSLVLLDHIIVGLNSYYSMKEHGDI